MPRQGLLVLAGANAAFRGGWAVLVLLPFVLLPVLRCPLGHRLRGRLQRHRHRSDDPASIWRLAKVLLLLLEQPGKRLVAVLLAVAEAPAATASADAASTRAIAGAAVGRC